MTQKQDKTGTTWWNPPCVRFGDADPRTFAFSYLLLALDENFPAYQVNQQLAKLAALGFEVRLTEASETPPELPVMTADERNRFEAGEKMYWQDPDATGGDR